MITSSKRSDSGISASHHRGNLMYTILIVDDVQTDRELIGMVVDPRGPPGRVRSDGNEAIAKAKSAAVADLPRRRHAGAGTVQDLPAAPRRSRHRRDPVVMITRRTRTAIGFWSRSRAPPITSASRSPPTTCSTASDVREVFMAAPARSTMRRPRTVGVRILARRPVLRTRHPLRRRGGRARSGDRVPSARPAIRGLFNLRGEPCGARPRRDPRARPRRSTGGPGPRRSAWCCGW